MKPFFFLCIGLVCFWSCSEQGRKAETDANKGATMQTSNVVVNENEHTNPENGIKDQTSQPKKLDNFRVDAYEDNKLVSRSFYRNALVTRYITYNTETRKQESEVEYFYDTSGELLSTKIIQGDASSDAELEAGKSHRDFLTQYGLLKSKGIEFPFPDIAADEVRDISSILSVADNYSDFKTETQNDGSRKIIKFVGFNKHIRFQPSTITLVVGANPILFKDFELTLENNFPTKESLKTDDGELTKTYSYKDGRLIGLIYKFSDDESRTSILEKRFEYSELR